MKKNKDAAFENVLAQPAGLKRDSNVAEALGERTNFMKKYYFLSKQEEE